MERGSVVYKQFPSLFNLSECPVCEKLPNPAKPSNLKKHTVKLQCLLDKVYKIPQEEEKEKDEEVHIETRQDKVADDGHAKINQDSISNTSDKLIFRSLFQKYKDLTGLEFEGSVVHQKESELIKKIMKNDEEIDEKWTR